ncbi:MAG: hypothetical protein DHS20C18_39320 [Saprospiraceae bacterium]|nr:MAG: hypothetical protein DHS20C18_39320 [Saprospiraceae bacterium]
MKKIYLAIGLLTLFLRGKTQQVDSSFQKKELPKTDIELVFSYYNQDGDHSAVTGGIGTEQLSVYGPNVKLTHSFKGYQKLTLKGGSDFITSASTDNIDFVRSSASLHDARSYAHINYDRHAKKTDLTIGIGTGFSLESDYLSFPVSLALAYQTPDKMRNFQLSFQAFFDDLRWGRLDVDYKRPALLVYPAELRFKEWADTYLRNSYTLQLGFTQVMNKRLIVGLFPEINYQKGLLSTPFHRVYFNDDAVQVENLPDDRLKIPIGLRLNYFLGGRTILKGTYGFYWDNFGIIGHAIELESAFKLSPILTLAPFVRFYRQSAADYFAPFKEHQPDAEYYTSDFDLSDFQSYKAGLYFRYAPLDYWTRRFLFNELRLRYAFFRRSDGLVAHIISFSVGYSLLPKTEHKND